MGRKKNVQPSRIFEDELRERGIINYQCFWEVRGPKDTSIAWLTCYRVGYGIVIVQTFDMGGWNALTDNPTNNIQEIMTDVLFRCGLGNKVPEHYADLIRKPEGEMNVGQNT